jgi:hypothetical protein
MMRRVSELFLRSVAPLLAAFLFVGSCSGGKSGFVITFKAGRVAVTAAWCVAGSDSESGDGREKTPPSERPGS